MKKRTVAVTFEGVTPYSPSKRVDLLHQADWEKLSGETEYERQKRNAHHHVHSHDGRVVLPHTALKTCLSDAAQYTSTKVKGKGNATYTKHFLAGVFPMDGEGVDIGLDVKDVSFHDIMCNSQGKKGGSMDVIRCYPVIQHWGGVATFSLFDDIITKDVFEETCDNAGQIIGLGRWRPRNGGLNGRFRCTNFDWS